MPIARIGMLRRALLDRRGMETAMEKEMRLHPIVSAISGAMPARRATRIEPVAMVRAE